MKKEIETPKFNIQLNPQYKDKYCSCCGVKNNIIWENLLKAKVQPKPNTIGQFLREWKGHKLFANNDYFYEGLTLKYCPGCGKEVEEEETKVAFEDKGEYWGAPCCEEVLVNHKCKRCGYEEEF